MSVDPSKRGLLRPGASLHSRITVVAMITAPSVRTAACTAFIVVGALASGRAAA